MTTPAPPQPLRQCPNPFAKLQAREADADELNRVQDNVKAAFDAASACNFKLVQTAFSRATNAFTLTLPRVANLSQLRALDVTPWGGGSTYTLVKVVSNGRIYAYDVDGAGSIDPDDDTLVQPDAGPGRWRDMGNYTPEFWDKDFWCVDPINGVNEHQGWGTDRASATAAPVKNHREVMRRLLGCDISTRIVETNVLHGTNEIFVVSGITQSNSNQLNSNAGGFYTIVGAAPVVRSGTLGSSTALQSDASNTAQKVHDASLPVSWAASDCISSVNGIRIMRTPDQSHHAVMTFQTSTAKVALTHQPVFISSTPQQQAGTGNSTAFVNGQSYEVIACVPIGGLIIGAAVTVRSYYIEVRDTSDNPSTAQVAQIDAATYYPILGGFCNAIIQGNVREFCALHVGVTSFACSLAWANGCGMLGASSSGGPGGVIETWLKTDFTTQGNLSYTRINWIIRGGCNYTQNLEGHRMYLYENQGFCIQLVTPIRFLVTTLHGSNEGSNDKPFLMESPDAWLMTDQLRWSDCCKMLLYGGYLGFLLGRWQFFGPVSGGQMTAEFNDASTGCRLFANEVFT